MSKTGEDFIKTSIGNGVGVIVLKRPQDGEFTAERRQELLAALDEMNASPETRAIILTGDGPALSFDIPLIERQNGEAQPDMRTVCDQISNSPKPVVAAMRGRVADTGLELCLAADARLAQTRARICITSLQNGRLCSGAALHTLAATLGPSLTVFVMGNLADLSVTDVSLAPLFTKIVGQNAVGVAAELARELAENRSQHTPALDNPQVYQAEITSARSTMFGRRLPPEKSALINAIEAAQLLPKPAAIRFCYAQDDALANTARTKALSYRRSAKLATLVREHLSAGPERLTLVGSGAAALRIAILALRAGRQVSVLPTGDDGFETFKSGLTRLYEGGAGGRPASPQQIAEKLALLTPLDGLNALAGSEWIIEAAASSVTEIQKRAAEIRQHAGERAVVMLTSGMRNGAGELSALLGPQTCGLQLHPDLGAGELAEVALGASELSNEAVRLRFLEALRSIGIPSVFQRAENGLAATRLFTALCVGCEEAIARGAAPDAVDRAMRFRVKPFAAQNAEGFRAQPFRMSAFFGAQADSAAPSLGGSFVAAGLNGGRDGSVIDPQTGALSEAAQDALQAWRATLPSRAPNVPPGEAEIRQITNAALYAMAARLLEDGTIKEAWAIDLVATSALGAASQLGGPLFETEQAGLLQMSQYLSSFDPLRPEFFERPDDMDQRIKEGLRYTRPGALRD